MLLWSKRFCQTLTDRISDPGWFPVPESADGRPSLDFDLFSVSVVTANVAACFDEVYILNKEVVVCF